MKITALQLTFETMVSAAQRIKRSTGLANLFRTQNSSPEMRLSAAICTANISAVADGDWALISPYGSHASPDGSYTQHFDRAQADKVVKTWNSISGTAARAFKNLWHKRGGTFSVPVWDGHPETDKTRWPVEKLLAEITLNSAVEILKQTASC